MKLRFKSNNIVPIILAAGRGSRMGGLTKDKPKSFIKISKTKRLIDKVIENFESMSFKKITIITGYKSNHFNQFKKINKIKNIKWKKTNILGSLICADKILSKHQCIVSYADIFYDREAIKILKQSKVKKGIVILSFKFWKKYWQKRFHKPLEDLETFKVNNRNLLLEIGDRTNSYKNIQGQYMGIFKIDPYTWYEIKKKLLKDIKDINKIDITALFQLILKKNICKIYIKNYKKKWFEVDSIKDLNLLKKSL
jgi:choline kinase